MISAKEKQSRILFRPNLPEIIHNFQQFTEILREIQSNDEIPENFVYILTYSLIKNKEFSDLLDQLKILELFAFDSIKCSFDKLLDINSINEAIVIIDKKQNKDSYISFDVGSKTSKDKLQISPKFSTVFGNSIIILTNRKFIEISSILEKPFVSVKESEKYFTKVILYLIQKIKMWGCKALTADIFSGLVIESECLEKPTNTIRRNRVPVFRKKYLNLNHIREKFKKIKKPFSKFDALVGIINSVDNIVAQDIFKMIGKFPLAIPLIIPNLNQENSYRCLLPLQTKINIKWCPTPGKIIENTLFSDKYKLIVTLRIGEAVEGKFGKSTILNQVLCTKNVFSCCGEPGGERGKPVTLDGSVELIWLTQETSNGKLWESVLQNHYKSGTNEVILLANLHGDALEFEETLNFLKSISTSYIVFLLPCDDDEIFIEKMKRLSEIFDTNDASENVSYIVVDPPNDCELSPEDIIIDTSKLASDSHIAQLRSIIGSCLEVDGKFINKEKYLLKDTLIMSEYIETKESKEFLKYIILKTCTSVKECLKLQRSKNFHDEYESIWAENLHLTNLIKLFINVLSQEKNSRFMSILNIENELCRIADKETSNARLELIKLQDELQNAILSKDDEEIISEIKKKRSIALKNINDIIIGPEHFFREIGKLYEIWLVKNPRNSLYLNTAQQYAELLIAGHAIELLDGDSESVSGPWLTAIIDSAHKILSPNIRRIFVISIIGLQSSGKSTLMNALFGCNFSVSVGQCTRGLFIRLLIIEESLRVKLKTDAILLIDSEGLGAPERHNEVDAEKKDRLMATFAMSISQLTLVNILGETMRDITHILQIAIVAMTRLEVSDITPDIMIVQHLIERNDERITTANTVIGEALEEAIDIAIKDNINLGVRDSKCLKTLKQTIRCGDLFFKFRPFKNGSSVNSPPSEEYHQDVVKLYHSILEIVKKNEIKSNLKDWNVITQSFWNAVKKENFMRFKDLKDLHEFLRRNSMISNLKESIISAFRYHYNIILDKLANMANKVIQNEITKEFVLDKIIDYLNFIPKCPLVTQCEKCKQFENDEKDLYDDVGNKSLKQETQTSISNHKIKTKKWFYKLLSQMLNVKIIQQETLSKISVEIENKLSEILDGEFECDEKEIENQASKIWRDIERDTAEAFPKVEIKMKILNEIKNSYENPDYIIEKFEANISLKDTPAISKKLFIPSITRSNNNLDIYELESELRRITLHLLDEKKTEIYEIGMILSLKMKVKDIIYDFENLNKFEFNPNFKWKIHLFALQNFNKEMEIAQIKWDKQYNPLQIIRKHKSFYLNAIGERLKHGYSYHSDIHIAAEGLLNAIKQKSKKIIDEKRIEEVLKLEWLLSPSSVRSEYLSELVVQVNMGVNNKALDFFQNPKDYIEEWFKDRVNCFSEDNKKDFEKIFKKELVIVLEQIESLKTIIDIRIYIKSYIKRYNGMYLHAFLDQRERTETDFNKLFKKIVETLKDLDRHKVLFKEIKFLEPSEDERVMNRLGCTESCPLCKAVCWSERGHENDEGETRKHYTCHQPMGLAGHHFDDVELISIPCHKQTKKECWYQHGKSISWSDMTKLPKYIDWKYEEHIDPNLNKLMEWFFKKLYKGISARNGIKPILFKKPKTKLNIKTLLASLRSIFKNNKYKYY